MENIKKWFYPVALLIYIIVMLIFKENKTVLVVSSLIFGVITGIAFSLVFLRKKKKQQRVKCLKC